MYYTNVIRYTALLLIFVLFYPHHSVSLADSELNDPMSPKLLERHRYKKGFFLCAIAFSNKTGYYAVVNDNIVNVGDEINGFLVKSIEKGIVILVNNKDNTEVVLRI